MSNSNKHLGKGLAAIFGENVSDVLDDIQQGKHESFKYDSKDILVSEIKPNPYQPRKQFDETKLSELAESIATHGVFTPILVKPANKGYELIAGERRLRASKIAEIETIPAIIIDFDDQQMMEISLLENVQRENLNVIEEANGYQRLIKNLNYTQDKLAKRIGKSREHVANMLRLLKLPKKVQDMVTNNLLSMGHVRALLAIKDDKKIEEIAYLAIKDRLSVRAVEQLVKKKLDVVTNTTKVKAAADIHFKSAEKSLQERLQTKVKIDDHAIHIHYVNKADLNRILEELDGLDEER